MFQSKLFLRLFMTYMAVIFFYMAMCITFLLYENHQISEMQEKRISEIQLEEVRNIVEQRMQTARNIVQNLSYSTVMKQLYMNTRTGELLDSYALFSIQNEMKNTMASGGLSIYKTVLFVEDSNKAYSSGGVIALADSYVPLEQDLPCIMVSTVNEAFQLNSTKRYSFNKKCLLYCDAYTYQSGSNIGTICILFDLKNLGSDIQKILGDGYGASILYQDNVIFYCGEEMGELYETESLTMPDLVCRIYAPTDIVSEVNHFFYITLLGIVVISIIFAGLAYYVSRKYYMPIDHLEQMVSTKQNTSEDEMEKIIHGIQDLIGEKNRYREKMLTITPYAKTGMLHSMIAGNVAADNVGIFLDENYLDLIRPYFIVSVINFAYDGTPSLREKEHKQKIEELFKVVTDTFSTDEIRIVYYFQDIYNVFLITNFETEQEMDELFYQIYKYVSTAKGDCHVTMGVDVLRDDIGELKQACEGAVKALDGILTDGRESVYFLEDMGDNAVTYYFPVNFREKLKHCLLKQDKEEVHTILFDIYKTNLDIEGMPEMYRSLIDEFHLSVIKTLREITELNTVHLNIKKYTGLATLQEIFDYYDAALLSVIDTLHEQAKQVEEDSRLEEDIAEYIDAHYCDADLSMQSLTSKFNVSNKYLSLLCKERFGVTYLQYIQSKRIEKAAELLREKRYSLTEIGIMCGYTNQLTFRRNFKSIMGVNPSVYQEKME